jgi:prepilin-type N-terminal cleavage/methylation domain-containing protein
MYSKHCGGFSLIELVVVIVMTGVLSAVAVISINAKAQHSATVQADQFRRDLSHLQLLAISQANRLKLTVASTGYSVCLAATVTCNLANAIANPATGAAFSVLLTDGVGFTGGTGDYYFDSLGRPVAGATGVALVADPILFSVNGVGRTTAVDITVLPITGFAQTDYN